MKYSDAGIYQRPQNTGRLLTHNEICDAIRRVADDYALTKVEYFGSYADGRANEESDLDLLVEFAERSVSLLRIIGLQQSLEEIFNIPVDVIHAPIPKDSFLEVNNTVVAYENQR